MPCYSNNGLKGPSVLGPRDLGKEPCPSYIQREAGQGGCKACDWNGRDCFNTGPNAIKQQTVPEWCFIYDTNEPGSMATKIAHCNFRCSLPAKAPAVNLATFPSSFVNKIRNLWYVSKAKKFTALKGAVRMMLIRLPLQKPAIPSVLHTSMDVDKAWPVFCFNCDKKIGTTWNDRGILMLGRGVR